LPDERPPSIVFLTQVYPPDPAAVGQHLADVAAGLAHRGNDVTVFTADRGFDDPSQKYPRYSLMDGVRVHRIPFGSFGKSSIALRLASGGLLMIQEVIRASLMRNVDIVVVSTSPPVGPFGAFILSMLRGSRLKYWPMDVNPDQMVALGHIEGSSPLVKAFDWMNRKVLERASHVIVLDEMMGDRLSRKSDISNRMSVVRPWAAEEPRTTSESAGEDFRKAHGFGGRRVIMYSGNHALSHPLTTILEAARKLRDDDRLLFAFVGGGIGKRVVDAEVGPNVVSLPYQPREILPESLAAADVHLVSIGETMPGIVHPSKIYGALAVGRPILLLGPGDNPIADLLERADIGWRISHGDVDGAIRVLHEIRDLSRDELAAKGARARQLLESIGDRDVSCGKVCDLIEQ
jgi:hypothetical protein